MVCSKSDYLKINQGRSELLLNVVVCFNKTRLFLSTLRSELRIIKHMYRYMYC